MAAGFDPCDRYSFDVDVDPDSGTGATAANANTVMVWNGAVANAVLTVVFDLNDVRTASSASFLDGPDPSARSSFATVSADALAVPAPAGLALFPVGLAAGAAGAAVVSCARPSLR